MKTYYVSLVQDFIGYYLRIQGPDENAVRNHMNNAYGPKVWCGVYDESEIDLAKLDKAKIIAAPSYIED